VKPANFVGGVMATASPARKAPGENALNAVALPVR